MDLNYSTNLIFPVPIHQFDVNGFGEIQDKLIDYAYDLKKIEPEGVSISNHGGWQSTDFFKGGNPARQLIKKECNKSFSFITLNPDDCHPP